MGFYQISCLRGQMDWSRRLPFVCASPAPRRLCEKKNRIESFAFAMKQKRHAHTDGQTPICPCEGRASRRASRCVVPPCDALAKGWVRFAGVVPEEALAVLVWCERHQPAPQGRGAPDAHRGETRSTARTGDYTHQDTRPTWSLISSTTWRRWPSP